MVVAVYLALIDGVVLQGEGENTVAGMDDPWVACRAFQGRRHTVGSRVGSLDERPWARDHRASWHQSQAARHPWSGAWGFLRARSEVDRRADLQSSSHLGQLQTGWAVGG